MTSRANERARDGDERKEHETVKRKARKKETPAERRTVTRKEKRTAVEQRERDRHSACHPRLSGRHEDHGRAGGQDVARGAQC